MLSWKVLLVQGFPRFTRILQEEALFTFFCLNHEEQMYIRNTVIKKATNVQEYTPDAVDQTCYICIHRNIPGVECVKKPAGGSYLKF